MIVSHLVQLFLVKRVQSNTFTVVIVDPVATHYPGFLNMQRLNVLFSRAKYGLYVVGNYSAWCEMKDEKAAWIQAFGEALVKHEKILPDHQLKGSTMLD